MTGDAMTLLSLPLSPALWLERDDQTAMMIRDRWTERAKARAKAWRVFDDAIRLSDEQIKRLHARSQCF